MNNMKFFLEKNTTLYEMYNMIRLLLIGGQESVNVAGLLYGLIKDKKIWTALTYQKVKGGLTGELAPNDILF